MNARGEIALDGQNEVERARIALKHICTQKSTIIREPQHVLRQEKRRQRRRSKVPANSQFRQKYITP